MIRMIAIGFAFLGMLTITLAWVVPLQTPSDTPMLRVLTIMCGLAAVFISIIVLDAENRRAS